MRTKKGARKQIKIETARFLVRNARIDDASDQWGHWMADAEASYMLNAPLKAVSKAEIETYIRMFDQRTQRRRKGFSATFASTSITGFAVFWALN